MTEAGQDENPELARQVDDRDRTADDRDDVADVIDTASEARDDRAEARDDRAEARESDENAFNPAASSDRAGARRDRQGGANDRQHAADDRQAASADRSLSARERALSLVDGLTGALRREAGMMEMERDLARAKRTKQPFILVFIDVDHLKVTNDSLGHDAGDRLLCAVVGAIREHIRPYDVIVRYGGDEFLCGLLDLPIEATTERFEVVNRQLLAEGHGSITAGFAQHAENETLEALVTRADQAMYETREKRAATPG